MRGDEMFRGPLGMSAGRTPAVLNALNLESIPLNFVLLALAPPESARAGSRRGSAGRRPAAAYLTISAAVPMTLV
jgi:hypothetical protein